MSECGCAGDASDTVPACGHEDTTVGSDLQTCLARVFCVDGLDGLGCDCDEMVRECCVCRGGVEGFLGGMDCETKDGLGVGFEGVQGCPGGGGDVIDACVP